MSDKIMTVSLGGEDRVLDFGRFHFTKFYQAENKANPNMTNAENLEAYIFSALQADCAFKKLPLPAKEQVSGWLGDLSNTEVLAIETKVVAIIKSEQPGE